MKTMHCSIVAFAALCSLLSSVSAQASGRLTLKSICRLKGQEEESIQGLGIVVGLKGTGDGSSALPTIRSVAKIMSIMGNNGAGSPNPLAGLDAKNVALVTVNAMIPAGGARQGDKIDCTVSSIGSAKSLAGGRLFLTALIGNDPKQPHVIAIAEGPITIEDDKMPNTGRIYAGCQMEEECRHYFILNNAITLVLEKNHADFQVAHSLATLVNSRLTMETTSAVAPATAIDQSNIVVKILPQYQDDPVSFVSLVLETPIPGLETPPRVVINERAGTIVIGGDVEIGAVAITHKNLVIDSGAGGQGKAFVPVDSVSPPSPKLQSLLTALKAVNAPPQDIIEIIKVLSRDGKLHAELIIE